VQKRADDLYIILTMSLLQPSKFRITTCDSCLGFIASNFSVAKSLLSYIDRLPTVSLLFSRVKSGCPRAAYWKTTYLGTVYRLSADDDIKGVEI
jgi:hypothetical protein